MADTNDFPSVDFNFKIGVGTADNRMYEYSSMRRMNQSCDFEIYLPWSGKHFLLDIDCSLFEWVSSPDAWTLTTKDGLHIEDVFPYAEWIECPDCGEQVPSNLRGGHGCE